MEISERPKRKGRPRKFPRDESATAPVFQKHAFPRADSAAEDLKDDAAKKEEVKKAAATIPEIFTPEQVIWVFDVYTGLLSFAYSLALKTPFDAIQEELAFSEEQKKLMAVPLAKICSKYAPPEWAGKTDEIQLITMLGMWTVMSFKRAKNVAASIEEKKKDAERTQPVQPIRREPKREGAGAVAI